MDSWTKLIRLSPDDDDETFFKKLAYLPEGKVEHNVRRFEKYAKYMKLLKCHLAMMRRPDFNVRLVHNVKYGWHLSSCIRSLPDEEKYIARDKCTCEEDILKPEDFFYRVQKGIYFRCKLCKRYVPEWEEADAYKCHKCNEEHEDAEKENTDRKGAEPPVEEVEPRVERLKPVAKKGEPTTVGKMEPTAEKVEHK